MKNYTKDELWKKLVTVSSSERPQAFVSYCQNIFELHKQGELNLVDASYAICGAVQFNDLTDIPQLDEAIEIACDLELPPQHRESDNEEQSWNRLNSLINNYQQSIKRT